MASPAEDGLAAEYPADGPVEAPVERAGHCGIRARLSSVLDSVEAFLEAHPFERGPWLVVAFATGIVAWVALPLPQHWIAFLLMGAATAILVLIRVDEARLGRLRLALTGLAIMACAGMVTIWGKSVLVGQPGVSAPRVVRMEGQVVERREEPAKLRVRLLLRVHLADFPEPVLVRVNVPDEDDVPEAQASAVVRLRARLMPPASPMLPGAYDFARAAWFDGIAATGSVLGKVEVVRSPDRAFSLRGLQSALATHIRAKLGGSPGNIAAALASGDRGAIAIADEEAMRDAGLTHLLSISGLHVSALVGAVYWIVARVLAFIPWIALRVRVPIAAALAGALAGIAYTLLTGAEVPTVRSCIGALLVLGALALGRDPLSFRMLAAGGLLVMLFWPEAVLGPSFQMSFSAVIAIIAFHSAAPVRGFLSGDHRGLLVRFARSLVLLLATGVVIELALMPIGLFHFHRAGIYGALANVVAIPLTTFITMPLIGLALLFDLGGLGGWLWWMAGQSLHLLLAIAHFVAARPGAVTMLPAVTPWSFALFVAGMLWLALWTGRVRLWGALPASFALIIMVTVPVPDILITGDGHHIGITGEGDKLLVLRSGRGSYMRDSLLELAGMDGDLQTFDDWPGANCSADFCTLALVRGGRRFTLLAARTRNYIDEMELTAACERVDIVIADRRLPFACHPRMMKADRQFLATTGGLAINLATGEIRSVAQTQGQHGWYRWPEPAQSYQRKPAPSESVPDIGATTQRSPLQK
ncbi:ComEC/Rec2 family competence protein [Novosphingobium sp. SL115]|uniref:ComEC/Rec2 family competence protein n=1 Tax=Novosphingobium sp. SL115 TaxID=2995150 RepID=UPI002274AF64|nr:ComEC/Rec2 family competence protein [Novosphingobium sp. SL115]MCY1671650.1 ComEC/Rec2 family competence protein [Novosphingobium sp. SL115]